MQSYHGLGPTSPSRLAVVLRTSGFVWTADGRHLEEAPPNSVSAHYEQEASVPRYQPPSSMSSSDQQATRANVKRRCKLQPSLPYLLLHDRQLLQITLQEGHLLLLRLAVAITDDIVVLLLDFIKLNLKFDNLAQKVSKTCHWSKYEAQTFSQRFCKSRMRDFLTPSNSVSCTLIALRVRSRS